MIAIKFISQESSRTFKHVNNPLKKLNANSHTVYANFSSFKNFAYFLAAIKFSSNSSRIFKWPAHMKVERMKSKKKSPIKIQSRHKKVYASSLAAKSGN